MDVSKCSDDGYDIESSVGSERVRKNCRFHNLVLVDKKRNRGHIK